MSLTSTCELTLFYALLFFKKIYNRTTVFLSKSTFLVSSLTVACYCTEKERLFWKSVLQNSLQLPRAVIIDITVDFNLPLFFKKEQV